jgi:hypothetical protein
MSDAIDQIVQRLLDQAERYENAGNDAGWAEAAEEAAESAQNARSDEEVREMIDELVPVSTVSRTAGTLHRVSGVAVDAIVNGRL